MKVQFLKYYFNFVVNKLEIDLKDSQEEKRSEPKSEEKQEETTTKVVDPKTRFVNAVEEFLDYLPWMLIILPNLVIFNEYLFEN